MKYEELKKLPLDEFILGGNFGFKLKYKGRGYLRATDGVNVITIWRKPTIKGHYLYSGWNTDGKAIDSVIGFLLNIVGLTHEEIRERYTDKTFKYTNPTPLINRAERELEDRKEAQNKLDTAMNIYNRVKHYKTNYLTKNRGIDSSVVEAFKGKAKANLCKGAFPLYKDIEKNLKGVISGVMYHFQDIRAGRRGKIAYGKKGLAVLKQQGNFDELYVCESVIDAMSLECLYKQCYSDNNSKRAYISTCGMPSRAQKEDLKRLFSLLENINCKITLAFDNDIQGNKYTDELIKYHTGVGLKQPREVKDWNDVLNDVLKNQGV